MIALALLTAAFGQVGPAGPPDPSPDGAAAAETAAAEDSAATGVEPVHLTVGVGRGLVVEPGWPIAEAVVANHELADIEVVNPTRLMIVGKQLGVTDVNLWGEEAGQRWSARVSVEIDLSSLEKMLAELLPDARLELRASSGSVVVSGRLRRAEDAASLLRLLEAQGIPFVDLTEVAGPRQVMIRVKVAEANRVAIRSLGINGFRTGNDAFFGSIVGGNPNGVNIGVPGGASAQSDLPFNFLGSAGVSDSTTLFAGFPGANFQLFINALEENQYIRTLAEPTLVALSGEEASFLAGGEFPIPVPQGSGLGGATVTVEYREFGVKLNFRPVVLGDGTIRLQVAPEVSDLSDLGAVEIQGFSIPSLLTRRAATTLTMRSGQTFAMAGLLDRSATAQAERVPGLGRIPILGTLFRSVRYERGDTELLILATVELVEPLDHEDSPAPGEADAAPSDWELFAKGKLHGEPSKNRPDLHWPQSMGLDHLVGPGAWARHDQRRRPALSGLPAALRELAVPAADAEPGGPILIGSVEVQGPRLRGGPGS